MFYDLYYRLREQFTPTALILSILAVVLAMGGAAVAAQGGLTAKQKKEVKTIAKGFQGTGPAGTPGANGANGKDGAQGPQGEKGKEGTNGTNGAAGKSVTVTAIAEGGSKCEGRAGAEVKQEGTVSGTALCSGKNGTTGFTETLPSGKTETGAWAFGSLPAAAKPASGQKLYVPISFPIPLPSGIDEPHVILANGQELGPVGEELTPTKCGSALTPAGTVANPRAAAGELCVYVGELTAGAKFGEELFGLFLNPVLKLSGGSGTDTAGARLQFGVVPDDGQGWGTFAVTAP